MAQSTMKLSKETLQRIREFGKMGDTFEDVINRLLDDAEEELEIEDDEEENDD